MSVQSQLDFAAAWLPELQARAGEFESARRLPGDVAREFARAGLFHLLVPREYGGTEVHPRDLVRIIKQVSIGDGSAGWNAMIGATTGLLAASMPEQYAGKIYGSAPGSLSVGVTAPAGRADVVDGGYRVNGRWSFASGCQNADWICGGCFVYRDGEQQQGDAGVPDIYLMMFEASQVEIEDTWHVSGLKGTGSHHISVSDAFVPEGRYVVLGGKPLIERSLYRFPLLGLLAIGVASVSLGIGHGALMAFRELAGAKKPTGSKRTLADRPLVQSDVARSIADLESAEAFMGQAIDDAWSVAEQGRSLDKETKARLRLAAVNATHSAVAAVDRLYQAGGGTAIYESSALQRCFRDIHVTTQHVMTAPPVYEVVGRVELGIDPGSML